VAQTFAMISEKLRANTASVLEESRRRGVTPHRAALAQAQERVRQAMRLRGQSAPAATAAEVTV
jgi:glutamate dehydrogenase (NAD(P)+)